MATRTSSAKTSSARPSSRPRTKPTSSTRTKTKPQTRTARPSRDRTALSDDKSRVSSNGRQLKSSIASTYSNPSESPITRLREGWSDGVNSVADTAGTAVNEYYDKYGDAAERNIQNAGELPAQLLDKAGFDGAADGVRDVTKFVGRQVDGFYDGVGAFSNNLIKGVGQLVGSPIETATNLGNLAKSGIQHTGKYGNPLGKGAVWAESLLTGRSPSEVAKQAENEVSEAGQRFLDNYRKTYEEKGLTAAVTQAGLDAGSLLLGGAGALTKTGQVARVATRTGRVAKSAPKPTGVPKAPGPTKGTPKAGEAPPKARRGQALDPEQKQVADRVNSAVEKDLDGFADRYLKENGNRVDLDEARSLFPEYRDNPAKFNGAVHQAAGRVAEKAYDRLLQGPKGPTKSVIFTGGGAGAGKSSALGSRASKFSKADAVFDSTLSNFERSRAAIDKALDSGRFAGVEYVYRNPTAAFKSTLSRANETGRPVNLDAFVATHRNSNQTIRRLSEHYAKDPRVSVRAWDNGGGPGSVKPLKLDDLPTPPANLKKDLLGILNEEFKKGNVSKELYDAIRAN